MTAVEQIQAAQRAGMANKKGKSVVLKLLPPLTSERLKSLQQQMEHPLPEELRALLGFCSGIDGASLDGIDFTGVTMLFEAKEIFPNGLPIAEDGCGNYWVLDLTPHTIQAAPVFFACHDAPVILYQSPDLASFLAEVFRMSSPPHRSLINEVKDDRLFEVWRKNPGVVDQPMGLASADPALREFAVSLPPHFQIVDLRQVSPGMGFSWGRYGHETEVRRHGYERIFGYAKPVRGGFLGKLFGH